MLFWAQAVCAAVASHRRDLGVSPDDLATRFSAIGSSGAGDGAGDGVRLPARTRSACSFRSAIVVRDGALDESCYDLLASEARLASFIAIAKGDSAGPALVPAWPWRHAGRRTARR